CAKWSQPWQRLVAIVDVIEIAAPRCILGDGATDPSSDHRKRSGERALLVDERYAGVVRKLDFLEHYPQVIRTGAEDPGHSLRLLGGLGICHGTHPGSRYRHIDSRHWSFLPLRSRPRWTASHQ